MTDEALITQYLAGDEKSLEILVQKYLRPVYSFVCRYGSIDAEDVVQDTFVKVWKNLKKFKGENKFKPWLFAIAKNTALDYLKKKKEVPMSVLVNADEKIDWLENVPDPAPLAMELLERADLKEKLDAALNRLSPPYRLVMFLRYNDHFNFREIGEALGEPLDTVKSRHRRGLIMLKEILST